MGAPDDERATLDSKLRVKGVDGLGVIDASVMTNLQSGDTNASTMVIAEVGSHLLLSDT